MTAHTTDFERAATVGGPAGSVQAALATEEGRLALFRAISAAVRSVMRGRPPGQIVQRIEEVFNETAFRALDNAGQLRPGHDPIPWMKGIARNIIRGDARAAASHSRRLIPIDECDPAWDRLTSAVAAISSAETRMDIESALAKLGPAARLAFECRYLRGLDGPELTDALGAPSDVAARQRVARATQAFRDLFEPPGSEVAR